jgi:hypothetical protein
MARCPECGVDRLIPLTFPTGWVSARDLPRPEVVTTRPVAKRGGCGARIYPDRISHRDDPRETWRPK